MKKHNKALLFVAMFGLSPFASADLKEMDDVSMSAAFGQAGVSIDLAINQDGVNVGEVVYTDEGSVRLQNIRVKSGTSDDVVVKQHVDVATNGELSIRVDPVENLRLSIGGSASGDDSAVALVATDGSQWVGELVNHLDMTLDLGTTTTTIGPNASNKLEINTEAAIRIDSMDVGIFGYTAQQAATRVGLTMGGQTLGQIKTARDAQAVTAADNLTAATNTLNTATSNYSDSQTALANGLALSANHELRYGADGSATVVDTASNDADVTSSYNTGGATTLFADVATKGGLKNTAETAKTAATGAKNLADAAKNQSDTAVAIATGSAITLQGMSFKKADGSHATIKQKIWAGNDGLYVKIDEISGILDTGNIIIGGASIGSVAVSDIDLSGMTQRIYGHP